MDASSRREAQAAPVSVRVHNSSLPLNFLPLRGSNYHAHEQPGSDRIAALLEESRVRLSETCV